jgi:hypothetical protein
MSNGTEPEAPDNRRDKTCWRTALLDRGIVGLVFGKNIAPALALALVIALCYLLVFKERYEILGSFMDILFVAVAFYFNHNGNSAGND